MLKEIANVNIRKLMKNVLSDNDFLIMNVALLNLQLYRIREFYESANGCLAGKNY